MLAGLDGGLTGDSRLLRGDAYFDGRLGGLLEVLDGVLAGVVPVVSQCSSLNFACSLLRVCLDHLRLVNKFKFVLLTLVSNPL